MRPGTVLLLSSVVFWTGGSRAARIPDRGAGNRIDDTRDRNMSPIADARDCNMSPSGDNITAAGRTHDVPERFYSDGTAFRSLRDTANGDHGSDGSAGKRTPFRQRRPRAPNIRLIADLGANTGNPMDSLSKNTVSVIISL